MSGEMNNVYSIEVQVEFHLVLMQTYRLQDENLFLFYPVDRCFIVSSGFFTIILAIKKKTNIF